jgi:hypothetical protein
MTKRSTPLRVAHAEKGYYHRQMPPSSRPRKRFAAAVAASGLLMLSAVIASCADVIGLAGVERVDCDGCAPFDGDIDGVAPHRDAGHDAHKPHQEAGRDAPGAHDARDDSKKPPKDAEPDTADAGCTSDMDCTSIVDPRCDLNTGTCVPCLPTDDNCPTGSICEVSGTTYACEKGCNTTTNCAAGDTCCGHVCVNTNINPSHCGGCANACSKENMKTVSCRAATCDGECASGFQDCDDDKLTNGCETNIETDPDHCGSCTTACSNVNIAYPTCAGGSCNGTCNPGFMDCDMDLQGDGCETDIDTNPSHCGSCTTACSPVNIATPTCTGGACSGVCNAGFATCSAYSLQASGCPCPEGPYGVYCNAYGECAY